jgi:HlyD family secretion protein
MKKRIIPLALLVIALAIAATWYWRGKSHSIGPLQLHGNVDIREAQLGFRVAGRIALIEREEGDAVRTGDVLARLDPQPLSHEVAEARARLEAGQARYELLRSGYRTQEVAQAQATLRERQVTFENAQRIYQRQQELFSEKTVSQQERDDAEARFREAEARLNLAREQLALLQAGFRAEEIAQGKAEVDRAQAALQTAELRLADTVLHAPAEGVVLTRSQEPGAVVGAGTPVLTIALTSPVWVRAYIDEPDLGKVHPGMKAEVYTDTAPDKPYAAQVGYISPRAEFTPRNVETRELRASLVYRLRLVVDQPDEGLRQGMPVTVKFKGANAN